MSPAPAFAFAVRRTRWPHTTRNALRGKRPPGSLIRRTLLVVQPQTPGPVEHVSGSSLERVPAVRQLCDQFRESLRADRRLTPLPRDVEHHDVAERRI